ncbi:MAG: domain protein putative component of TonB system, partial [Labilithrix sp.]|nr:domain protein putative component of TonB system [Labilithrix sp.]
EEDLAAEVYESARQLAPADLPILHKLLALYQKAKKWASLFTVLRSIAEVDTDLHRRAKTLFTMGQIANTELLDRGTALELFDRTLDVDPSQLEAFERIVRILTETKDWSGLDQMYRKMIARADARSDRGLSALLNKQLAIVHRDRIGDPGAAIQAVQATVALRPNDEEAQAILRELLALTGQASGAVAITLERVLKEPMDPRPYPALFDLLVSQNARDRALCVASAMNFLDVAHPVAAGWRQSYPQPPLEGIMLDLGPEGYRTLLHPELDADLTAIFEVVAPAVIDVALSRLSLRERISHPGPALKGQDWLVGMATRAAAILGAPPPKLCLRRTPGPALAPAATKPPSLLVYVQALAGVNREVLAFMIGKRVLELTPPLLARALCPSVSELKALASSAARIATDQTEPADLPLKERLKRDDVARIAAAVHASMAKGGKLDVLRWSQLADVSVSYGGLLLAGDLEAARAAIALEPQAPGDLSPRDKMRELVAWFLGETSADLRRRLGVART